MSNIPAASDRPWRVAIVRDGDNAALIRELTDRGFVAAPCPVMREEPPADPARLRAAALALETFDWLVVASTRAVRALVRARPSAWPLRLRTAAVGHSTAAALVAAGASRPPVVGHHGRRRRPVDAPARRAVLDERARAVPDRRGRTADGDRGTPRTPEQSSTRSRPIARRRWRQPTYRPPGLRSLPMLQSSGADVQRRR